MPTPEDVRVQLKGGGDLVSLKDASWISSLELAPVNLLQIALAFGY